MSLVHFRIFGYEIEDAFVAKITIGIICAIILFLLIGQDSLYNWIIKSLVIWIAATLIIVPLLYAFIEERLEIKHLIMIVIGIAILAIYIIYYNAPLDIVYIGILQAIVWMTIFSIILDALRDTLKK